MTGLGDARRAAALWLAQTRAFAKAMVALPRARSLNAELFFADPRSVLRAATAHFEIDMTADTIERCIRGPLFSTYSKNPAMTFDNDTRIARRDALQAQIDGELREARDWIGSQGAEPAAVIAGASLIR
jgi:hypothetical protein